MRCSCLSLQTRKDDNPPDGTVIIEPSSIEWFKGENVTAFLVKHGDKDFNRIEVKLTNMVPNIVPPLVFSFKLPGE